MTISTPRVVFAGAALMLAACAPAKKPQTAANPAADPRNNLKAGLFDAGEFTSNMKVVGKAVSPNGFLGITNSDLAFTGNYVIQGNYNGPVVWDISTPSSPKLVVAYECPASQNDVSVYKNLMFMSAEAQNGRIDCKPGGVREAVSKERMRGVRVFDISNIKEPKLVANVQTCRLAHAHGARGSEGPGEHLSLRVRLVWHPPEHRTRRLRGRPVGQRSELVAPAH